MLCLSGFEIYSRWVPLIFQCQSKALTRKVMYLALRTDTGGDNCFSSYQISWIKMKNTFL